MAITFGLDLSHHQPSSLDLAQARREGCEFVILKAGEGSSYVDPDFASNLEKARSAGLLVAAYWYQRSNATASQHINGTAAGCGVRNVVPSDVPVIPDVEANSGSVGLTRQFVDALRTVGYRVPLLYLPRWYWQQLGSPPLTGLPPLWSSRYPDNAVGLLAAEWTNVPASYWDGYGGLDVAVLQFTSSATIAGYSPLDANAYRGTRDQLTALLAGTNILEADLTPEESNRLKWCEQALRTLVSQVTGDPKGDPSFDANMNWLDGHLPGFPSLFDGTMHTLADYTRLADLHSKNTEDQSKAILEAVKANTVALSDDDLVKLAQAVLAALPTALAKQIVDEEAARLAPKES